MEFLTKRISYTQRMSRMATLVLVMGSVACGPMENATGTVEAPSTHEQELAGENGVTLNGVTLNGVTLNGLAMNGLGTADFAGWFAQDTALNSMVMKYVVKCAAPAGQSRSYQDASTGTTYTWQGSLGLAPDWASGQQMTEAEQQLVSACLAAHVNKYGMHVPLSVLGRTARQQPIAYSSEELQTFRRREACFFGNLFTGEGVFAGTDGLYLNDWESSTRACGLTTLEGAQVSQCSPIVHVESCDELCTLDPSGLFYTECTYNGRTYLPLTTRIRPEEISVCGDGVCQVSESCGTGSEANNCMTDCGACQ
ncbi:hypothetical protein [Hyalangium gracile]|uniref:hypothetical protein n=1 Tax=Hyalangium gracile TaxID=394092 RepID=UPI001CCA6BC0|nr:hypothetical protein [Hyalangium gracile]